MRVADPLAAAFRLSHSHSAADSTRNSTWADRYVRRLVGTDLAAVAGVTFLSYATLIWFDRITAATLGSYALLSAAIAFVWMMMLSLMRSRDARFVGIGLEEYRLVVAATSVVFGGTAVSAVLLQVVIPRSYFVVALPAGIVVVCISRHLNRRWLAAQRRKGAFLSRVVVAGEPADVQYVISQILRRPGSVEYNVVGAVLPPGSESISVVAGSSAVPVVGYTDGIPSVVPRVDADAVIIAGHVTGGGDFIRQLGWQLEVTSTELVLAPGLTNIAGPRIHWRPVEGLPLMHVELPQYGGTKHVIKRIMDVVLASIALVLIAPVLLACAILIRRDSTGAVFFRQQRVGRNGSLFTIFKLRTMTVDAEARRAELQHLNEAAGPLFKISIDPRVTRIGAILRRYSLDELPQFWNVLKGDMSLVGPRPPLPSEVSTYDSMVRRRLYSKPGITGLWQTMGRSNLAWEESVRLDLYYVENWSITGDVLVLFRTVRQLLRPSGAF